MRVFHDAFSKFDYLLALLAGASLVFAFAPFEFRIVAWLAPAVFFWLNLKPLTNAQRLRLAWVFGVGLFAGGTHWIYVSIHFFGGANAFVAALMVAIFVLFMALFLLLFGWLARYFSSMLNSWKLLLVFPALWTLTEWFRSWFLTGFPWLQLGVTQLDTWLAAYAPVTGVLGVSWLVALGSGALVLFLIGNKAQRVAAISVVFITTFVGLGLSQIRWVSAAGEPLYISMLQGNIDQNVKWVPEYRNTNIQTHFDLMHPDVYPDVERSHLVIWSETALSDYFLRATDVLYPLQDWANESGADVLVGGFFSERGTPIVYNAVMAIGKGRDVDTSLETAEDVYGKKHLVPFSEYIPFLKYLRFLESVVRLPYDNVTAWQGGTNLTLAGQPMRISVCYEDAYGDEMRDGLPEATMLLNVSNDGWFKGSIEPAQHAELARMRALETGRFLLRSTNNGLTAIINEKGQVLNTGPQYEQTVISGYAMPLKGETPYVSMGNWLIIALLCLALCLPIALWQRRVR